MLKLKVSTNLGFVVARKTYLTLARKSCLTLAFQLPS